ncbi:MAG: hypothetical protein SCH71_02450 [Desulfobulbaceae bacterium]|nr:hypothetical protein [Desulfobulbaceae bacterium]
MKGAGLKSSLHLTEETASLENDKNSKKVTQARLVNYLNRINFKDGDITLNFKHKKYGHPITLLAKPQICNDNFLLCIWSEHFDAEKKLKQFTFTYFSFTDGLSNVCVEAKLLEISRKGVYLGLPEYCYERTFRGFKRYLCNGITAQISQDGYLVKGTLINFCAESFTVKYALDSQQLQLEMNPDNHVNVQLINNKGDFVFFGECAIIRQEKYTSGITLVLKNVKNNISRMKSKTFRTERLVLSPLPNLIFHHPLTQKKIILGLKDISGLGFSIEEDAENSVLLPGLIITDLGIDFIQGFTLKCKAQVLYRITQDDVVTCGFVILDINLSDHIKLSSLIHQAKNKHSCICTSNVDLDSLWDFFFDSGFVYPEKYLQIADQKEIFIDTYKKLYNEKPEIAQHIIYQDKGKIYGHISIYRFYEKTWLLHHLAAIKSTKHKAGLVVLEHILQHINELHSLPPAKMDFLAGYYRPNNRFSKRLFGSSATGSMGDSQKSSIDEFAYFHFQPNGKPAPPFSALNISDTDPDDLEILKYWYDEFSGGLLIKALDLTPEANCMGGTICDDYSKAGFKRKRKLFSIKTDDELVAVLIVNISDFGINMSNLTNCIQIFVLDPPTINKEILNYALVQLAEYYEYDNIPVLFYPKSYAELYDFSSEKTYLLGILNLEYIGEYLKYMESLTLPKKQIKIKQVK